MTKTTEETLGATQIVASNDKLTTAIDRLATATEAGANAPPKIQPSITQPISMRPGK